MPSEELGRVVEMPVSCPHCPKYSMQPISFLVGKNQITCKECKSEIDLTTKEWTAFLKKFEKALKDLQPS